MTNPAEELKKLYDSLDNKRSILNILRAERYKHLVDFLNRSFPMLADKKYSIGMKIYWFLNGIRDFPRCRECGGPNKTNRCHLEEGYLTEYCCRKCATGESRSERMRLACLEKYGVDNPLKAKDVRDRQKETLVERYGVENISHLKETVERIAQTKLERYGDPHFTNREKAARTNMERFGVDNPFKLRSTQKKCRETMKEKYGAEHAMQVKDIHDSVSGKIARRMVHNSYENFLMTNPYSYPAFTEEFYLEHRDKTEEFEFVCRKCGKHFRSRVHNGSVRRCPKCYSSVTTSGMEQELFDYLVSIYSRKILRKDRTLMKGKEIDIVIPEKRIAIEFDGAYWHSELNGIGKGYHLEKTEACESAGYQLIHVFEDEWEKRQEIVKSRIANLLGIYGRTIYARKCGTREITREEERDFLERNHIQGWVVSSHRYGLEFEGELVAVMTFSKKRAALGWKSSEGEFELLRFCPKRGCHVVGGAGKLLRKFEKEVRPEKLVSYADRRWSVGKLYLALGFELDHVSPPNYWYLNNGCSERYHRYGFRKSVLESKLEVFDPDLSEAENMRRNKFTRIWDCGNLVFVKEYKKTEA